VLPVARRLKRSGDFSDVFRAGSRAGNQSVVVHVRRLPNDPPGTSRVGFVVSKQVGNSVMRNRVKRRMRHLVAGLEHPYPSAVVVRALPAAAVEPGDLAVDLPRAWDKAHRRAAAA